MRIQGTFLSTYLGQYIMESEEKYPPVNPNSPEAAQKA